MSQDRTAIARLLRSKERCCERRGELGAEELQSSEAKLTPGRSRGVCNESYYQRSKSGSVRSRRIAQVSLGYRTTCGKETYRMLDWSCNTLDSTQRPDSSTTGRRRKKSWMSVRTTRNPGLEISDQELRPIPHYSEQGCSGLRLRERDRDIQGIERE